MLFLMLLLLTWSIASIPFRTNAHKVADAAVVESISLQIGLYLGLKELHVSRCVWRGFILDCDVDMRLCVVKLAKKASSVC